MTVESACILENLLRGNDLGWMIDLYAPPKEAIPFLIRRLEELTKLAESRGFRNRFGGHQLFTPEILKDEFQRSPHKILAFLQALGVTRKLEMLLMVWRILHGFSIREVEMSYRERESFTLNVKLGLGSNPDTDETYKTNEIFDAVLLRNFGITVVDGRPLFDGFLPKRG